MAIVTTPATILRMAWSGLAARLARAAGALGWRFGRTGRFRRHAVQAMMGLSTGVCLYDRRNRLLLANEAFCRIFGIPPDSLRPGLTLGEVMRASQAACIHPGRSVEDMLHERQAFIDRRQPGTVMLRLAEGRRVCVRHQPLPGGGWLASYEDVTGQQRAEEQVRFMARHDPLTGLANQTALRERIAALSEGPVPASLIMINLDRFKEVNDDLGHGAGDTVLQEVAARLRRCVPASALVARRGGDEFALLLTGPRSQDEAGRTADALMRTMTRPLPVGDHTLRVSTSIGIATYLGHASTPDELLCNAEQAMHLAKADGACVRWHTREMRLATERTRAYDTALQRAVDRSEFEVFYQPQVCLRSGALIGAEALLRWRHPNDGLLTPAAFLNTLEARPISAEVGQWVLRTACAQAAAWRAGGAPNFRMAVNLFGTQLRTRNILDDVRATLAATALPAEALELEITENILLRHDDAALAPLFALRALGVCLSFDDYGTGYASLSMLKRVPITRLKIDRSFVRGLCLSQQDAAIVRAILDLGRSFGFAVIAEGVATQEHAQRLLREGCVEGQGYLFGRPMTAEAFQARFEFQPGSRVREAQPA